MFIMFVNNVELNTKLYFYKTTRYGYSMCIITFPTIQKHIIFLVYSYIGDGDFFPHWIIKSYVKKKLDIIYPLIKSYSYTVYNFICLPSC